MIKDIDSILLCAFRYAIKRQTYMTGIISEEIINAWNSLQDTTKELIIKEIDSEWDDISFIDRKVWNSILIKNSR